MAEFNWGQLQKEGEDAFRPIPEGTYILTAKEVKHSKTKEKGKLMFRISFTVEAGPEAGKTVFHNITLSPESPAALNFFFRDMSILGVTQDIFATDPTPDRICALIAGRRIQADVKHQEWEGQTRANIKSMSLPNFSAPAVMGMGGPAVAVAAKLTTPVAKAAPPVATSPTPVAVPVTDSTQPKTDAPTPAF